MYSAAAAAQQVQGSRPAPRLDELRAADRAYERLAQMAAATGPLRLSGGSHELVITHQELLFQLAQMARQIGSTLICENTARDTEAATFYYSRAVRKLRLAGIPEKDEHMRTLLQLVQQAEAQAEALKISRLTVEPDGAGGGGGGGRSAIAQAEDESYCVLS